MRHTVFAIVILILGMASSEAVAQQLNVIDNIQRDSIITVVQPAALAQRLYERQTPAKSVAAEKQAALALTREAVSEQPANVSAGTVHRMAGYRVQVFSDNNAATAQNEARAKARAIGDAMPQYHTYVTFEAPFWRLRVGDFRSRHDAEDAADEVKRLFPRYSREVRVVRDRVNIRL